MGLFKPSTILDVLEPTRLEHEDIYALLRWSRQFIEVLKWAIMVHVVLERHLAVSKEALRKADSIKNTSETTYCKLETQLKDSYKY